MTYTRYFLFQIISFIKYFYVSLRNNFFYCFCGGPLVVKAPGQLPSLPPPPLHPAPLSTLGGLVGSGFVPNFCATQLASYQQVSMPQQYFIYIQLYFTILYGKGKR